MSKSPRILTDEEARKVEAQLWFDQMPPGLRVFAILDAARHASIYPAVQSCRLEWVSLYLGKVAKEIEEVAPYLVKLEKEDPFTKNVIANGWADHWGIYFWAPAELAEVRKHFRKFLTVKDEDGNELVFRYYDPRIFRVYLPTCLPTELDILFGPVHEFIIPAKKAPAVVRYRFEEGQLVQEEVR